MKRLFIDHLILILALATLFIPIQSNAEKSLSIEEIKLLGKNVLTITGFYETCGSKKVIDIDRRASRIGYHTGMKYMLITGISNELNKWADAGQNGFMLKDVNTSDTLQKFSFSKENCNIIKNQMNSRLKEILKLINI